MASFIYNIAKRNLLRSTSDTTAPNNYFNLVDNSGSGGELQVALLCKTAASTLPGNSQDPDHTIVSQCIAQSGYYEYDGSSYSRQDMSTITLATDNTDDEVEISAGDVSMGSPGASTDNVRGILVFYQNTDDDDSFPVAWLEGGNVQTVKGNGQSMNISWPGLFAALQDV